MPMYATVDDYAEYVGHPVEEFTPRHMVRASQCVDKGLLGAIYPTDSNGMPTGNDTNGVPLIEVFRDATCAAARPLVEDWDEIPTPPGCCSECQLTDEAFDILREAGLLPPRFYMHG
jgi:hypothetical protein